MLRFVLAASLLAFAVGCGGSDVYDEDRVPEGAADTSDPSSVQMEAPESGMPKGAQPGPPSN